MKKLLIVIVSLILPSCNNQQHKEEIDSLNKTIDSLEEESAYSTILRLNFQPNESKLVYGEENTSNAIYEFKQGYGMGFVDYIFYTKNFTNAYPTFLSSASCSTGWVSYEIKDDKENVIEKYQMEENLVLDLTKTNPEKLEILTEKTLIQGRNKALELAIKTLKKQE